MTRKQIDKVMSVLLTISVSLILIGAIFRLQHWIYDDQIFWTGFILSLVLGSFEINRLKKIIKSLENDMQKSE
ncbi:hypothetical protein [Labilibaculum euxinus]